MNVKFPSGQEIGKFLTTDIAKPRILDWNNSGGVDPIEMAGTALGAYVLGKGAKAAYNKIKGDMSEDKPSPNAIDKTIEYASKNKKPLAIGASLAVGALALTNNPTVKEKIDKVKQVLFSEGDFALISGGIVYSGVRSSGTTTSGTIHSGYKTTGTKTVGTKTVGTKTLGTKEIEPEVISSKTIGTQEIEPKIISSKTINDGRLGSESSLISNESSLARPTTLVGESTLVSNESSLANPTTLVSESSLINGESSDISSDPNFRYLEDSTRYYDDDFEYLPDPASITQTSEFPFLGVGAGLAATVLGGYALNKLRKRKRKNNTPQR